MNRALAFVLIPILIAILCWPIAARAPEPSSLFAPGHRGGIVAAATDLGWTAERLVSTPAAIGRGAYDSGPRVLLVVSPQRPFTATDRDALVQFVAEGGDLIVADAFAEGNSAATPFGVNFDRGRLVEPDHNVTFEADGKSIVLPVANATSIHVGAGVQAHVLAQTGPQSFIDLDGDGLIGASDPSGPFPLVVEVSSPGMGKVVLVSEPSWLTSETGAAAAFRRAILVHLERSPGLLVIDEAHAARPTTFTGALAAASRAAFLPPTRTVILALAAVLALLVLWPFVRDGWGPHEFRPERFISREDVAEGRAEDGPRARPTARWTPRGLAALAGGAALLVLGILLTNREAQYAGAFLLLAAAAATFARAPAIDARLQIDRKRLEEARAITVDVEVENLRGRAARVEIRQRLPPEFEVGRGSERFRAYVRGHDTLHHSFELVPAVRGEYELGPTEARVEDPLRLRTEGSIVGDPLLARVAPQYEKLRTLPFGTRIPMVTMGPHLVNRAGDGTEFHSLRNYQVGDSIRIVNWKASARSKDLVVNQRVHETMTNLAVVFDARAVSGVGPSDSTPIARLARAVAGLSSALLRVRDRVHVYVYGEDLVEMPRTSGARQFEMVLDLLATVKPGGNLSFLDAARKLVPRLRAKMPLLLVTCAEADPTIPDGLAILTQAGVLPLLITAPVHAEKDPRISSKEAGRLVEERGRVLQKARGLGVPVHELRPGVTLEEQLRFGGAVG